MPIKNFARKGSLFRRFRKKGKSGERSRFVACNPTLGDSSPKDSAVDEERDADVSWAEAENAPSAAASAGSGPSPPGAASAPPQQKTTRSISYVVPIPEGVRPMDAFDVWAGNRVVTLRLPPNQHFREGKTTMARFSIDAPPDSPGVEYCGGWEQYIVEVPPEIEGGEEGFIVTIMGQKVSVRLPSSYSPGTSRRVKIRVPSHAPCPYEGLPRASPESSAYSKAAPNKGFQLFELEAPISVGPGDSITVVVKGMECLVTLPAVSHDMGKCGYSYNNWNEKGRKVRFSLPSFFTTAPPKDAPQRRGSPGGLVRQFRVVGAPATGGGAWHRAFRATDLKFQWIRVPPGKGLAARWGGRTVPSADLAERLARKAGTRKWIGGTTLSTNGMVPVVPVRFADECRYTLLLCLELCADGRAESEDGWLSGLADLPPDVRGLVMRFAAFGDGAGSTDNDSPTICSPPALVRRVVWEEVGEENKPPLRREGSVDLVPVGDVLFGSHYSSAHDLGVRSARVSVSHSDLFSATVLPLEDRVAWLRDKARRGEEEHVVCFDVRRGHLFEDSVKAIMAMDGNDLRNIWKMKFVDETCYTQDAGEKRWRDLISQCFLDCGLLATESSDSRQPRWRPWNIKPSPGEAGEAPEDYLLYFRFLGRLLARALLDGRRIPFLLGKHLYKLLLGWPITLDDVQRNDPDYYQSLVQLTKMPPGDIEFLCLDFTTTSWGPPPIHEVELVPGGANIDVTCDNLPEYLEACVKHRLFGRMQSQSRGLVLGFLDIIPEPLLSIFTVDEFEGLLFDISPTSAWRT